MKKLNMAIALGMLAGALTLAPRTFAADMTNADKAAAYEQKATDLDAVIAEHKAMKKEGVTEKTQVSVRQKMDKHCDAIIADATKLRDDYKAFATWYRLQATEEKK